MVHPTPSLSDTRRELQRLLALRSVRGGPLLCPHLRQRAQRLLAQLDEVEVVQALNRQEQRTMIAPSKNGHANGQAHRLADRKSVV